MKPDKKIIIQTGRGLFLVFLVFISLFPVYWTFVNSFRTNTQIMSMSRLIPEQFILDNYVRVFTLTSIIRYFFNSLIITSGNLALLSFCSMLVSFVLSRYKFKLGPWIYLLFTAGIFIPGITLMGMIYKLIFQMGLVGSRAGVILLYTASSLPLSVFLLTSYMQTIPREIDESAVIDGCTTWQLFSKMIFPLSRNGWVVVLIIAFVTSWNEYIWAMLLLPRSDVRTFTVALATFKTENVTDYGLLSACVIIGLAPVIAAYSLLQDRMLTGIAAASVKG
ncbi:MAG: carbohydrate ABC transporter permease [Treponema sp.]|nr:carbohydrate ABC transporter permease [Treponema sp.]